jgi:hypothetical protein
LVQFVESSKNFVQTPRKNVHLAQDQRAPGVIQLRGRIIRRHWNCRSINAFDKTQNLRRLNLCRDGGNSWNKQAKRKNEGD